MKPQIILSFLLCCWVFAQQATAQNTPAPIVTPPTETIEPARLHQLYLPKPAIKIGVLRHRDGEVLDGELTPDGLRIIIKNYTRRNGVEVEVLFKDGTEEKISRSPCVIDEVPAL